MILSKRAAVRRSDTATIREWLARDVPGSIAEVRSHYGRRRYFLAVRRLDNGNQAVISRHRLRSAAIRSLREYGERLR